MKQRTIKITNTDLEITDEERDRGVVAKIKIAETLYVQIENGGRYTSKPDYAIVLMCPDQRAKIALVPETFKRLKEINPDLIHTLYGDK